MANIKQDAIAKRIRSLLNKTIENGCTEEEAMLAADKAGELMDKYDLSFSQVQMKKQKIGRTTYYTHTRKDGTPDKNASRAHEVSYAVGAVAAYCDCEVWQSGADIVFFGMPKDREIAEYLSALIKTAMESDFKAYKKSPDRDSEVHGKRLRTSFMAGYTRRVSARLRDMKKARDAGHKTTGKELVVVKMAVVTEAFAALNLNLRNSARRSNGTEHGAYSAGKAAGNRVSINAGVGSKKSAGAIA